MARSAVPAPGKTFVARLLRSDRPPESITVTRNGPTAPKILRRPGGGGGEITFEVFALADADGWPASATFTFIEAVTPPPGDPDV